MAYDDENYDDEWEPAPEGGFAPADEQDIEEAPPYQVAGPPIPPPRQQEDDDWEPAPEGGFKPAVDAEGYVTDPGLLKQLGTPSDEGYVTDPDLLRQLGTPARRFAQQGAAVEDPEWEPMPVGGFRPEPSLWDTFLASTKRGVSGAAQSGELLLNTILGRPTETGTEERPIPAEEIRPSEALTSPIEKGLPWLAYQTGRAAPAMVGAVAGGPAGGRWHPGWRWTGA